MTSPASQQLAHALSTSLKGSASLDAPLDELLKVTGARATGLWHVVGEELHQVGFRGVAEMPDEQTAKEIARADHERTRVYLSLKTDNAITAIQAWVKAVGDPEQAAKCLSGVMAQKLLRKLCINCRVAYQPSASGPPSPSGQ